MKDRILHIMQEKNMTQQEFAVALDISPASLSNIFNGRSNPTNNHVQAIHRCFPEINVNWLMFGEGNMYNDMPDDNSCINQPLQNQGYIENVYRQEFDSTNTNSDNIDYNDVGYGKNNILSSSAPIIKETIKYIDRPQRKIKEIRIFFDDGTYEVYSGNS